MPSSKSPFDALEKLRDRLPVGTPPKNEAKPDAPEPKGPARAVVRLERKQRRGKEVTVVEKLGLKMSELEAWCKQLKQAMGCGGTVEGDAIVLQGDLRARLPDALTKLGVRNVTVSG
jgi:translation initiation factor 1